MININISLAIISSIMTLMFFLAGVDKIVNFTKVVTGFQRRLPGNLNITLCQFAILIAILIEIIAPIVIVYSFARDKHYEYAKYAIISLILFTILATLMYHFPPTGRIYYPFISNVASVGGLMLLYLVTSLSGLNEK